MNGKINIFGKGVRRIICLLTWGMMEKSLSSEGKKKRTKKETFEMNIHK